MWPIWPLLKDFLHERKTTELLYLPAWTGLVSVGQAGSKDVLKQGKKVSLGPRTCGTKLYNFESILETHRVNDPRVPGQADSPPPYHASLCISQNTTAAEERKQAPFIWGTWWCNTLLFSTVHMFSFSLCPLAWQAKFSSLVYFIHYIRYRFWTKFLKRMKRR